MENNSFNFDDLCLATRPLFNFEAEELWVISLNSLGEPTHHDMVFRGTLNACLFHPRDIFRKIIQRNACLFVMAHNHPSGDPRPSESDIEITKKIFLLSRMMAIPMVDHIILSKTSEYSFRGGSHYAAWRKYNSSKVLFGV